MEQQSCSLDGTAVTDATNFSDWGEATVASTVQLEPGLWSLDNFGQALVATIANETFTWDAGGTLPLTTRAATTTSGLQRVITHCNKS